MRGVSPLLVCLLVVLAGCAGGGGTGGDAPEATGTATATATASSDDGNGGGGDAGDGDSNEASGSSSGDEMPDAIPVLRTGESYEYEVRSALFAEEAESGTIAIDVTAGGEWPEVEMEVVRDAPSGRLEAVPEAAAFSAALGEMTYALNVRNLVVSSRIVAGKSTDIRTYEVGDSWRFAGSDTEANFEVVGEERVGGVTAKHVKVTGGAESDLDADIWLAPGVGFPVKFVQTEDGEATMALTLASHSG